MTTAEPAHDRRVVLIDLSSLYWSCWHATAHQQLSEASANTMSAIRRCYKDGDLVAICCDKGKSFRKDISADYKANRPEKDMNAIGELERLKERLAKDGHLLWAADGFEADDIIATAVRLSKPHPVLICSADKDLCQLVGAGVRILRTHSWVEGGEAEVTAKFGVKPAQLLDYLALIGDKSDNIPGADGIGPKTAAAILTECGSLDAAYDRINAGKLFKADGTRWATPRQVSILLDNAKQIVLAQRLVALDDSAPIDFTEIYAERKPAPLVAIEEVPEMIDFDDIPLDDVPAKANGAAKSDAALTGKPQPEDKRNTVEDTAPVTAGQTKDLVPTVAAEVVEFTKALEPRSFSQAITVAQYLYNSRLYQKFNSFEAIAAVIMRGREMGLGAGTALAVIEMIEGKPALKAHFIIDRATEHPMCEYFMLVESSEKSATYETKHVKHPKPTRLTYTIEQAQLAGRIKPAGNGKDANQWVKMPAEMLRKTCGVQLARIVYPGATLGLYAIEELE